MAPPQPPAATLTGLQAQLDAFTATTTPGGRTAPSPTGPRSPPPSSPAQSRPRDCPNHSHHRVRTDIIGPPAPSPSASKLHPIGVGRTHPEPTFLLLIRDLSIRIIDAATGELLRELTLDPSRNYQPTGRPPGPTLGTPAPTRNPEPEADSGVLEISRGHIGAPSRTRTCGLLLRRHTRARPDNAHQGPVWRRHATTIA